MSFDKSGIWQTLLRAQGTLVDLPRKSSRSISNLAIPHPIFFTGTIFVGLTDPIRTTDTEITFYAAIWQRDNEHIHSGYRPASKSLQISCNSIFAVHNETVNIHSHVIGSILFFLLPLYAYHGVYLSQPNAGVADLIVFAAFFFGVATCFLLSAWFHIISNHSPRVAALGNQLDYLGVVILMWGATIPTVYYGFCDNPELRDVYWTLVSVLALSCAVATVHPRFRKSSFRPYRALMYAGLGLSAIVFILHGVFLYGWSVQNQRMSLNWMVLMACLNLVGGGIYAARVPEKFYPRTFDIFGSSHQILHCMVILAGLAHMVGLFKAFNFVHTYKG